MKTKLEKADIAVLHRKAAKVSRCEDALSDARNDLLLTVDGFVGNGVTQAAVAEALGITRATLNQKLRAAGMDGSKASKAKQGKH